MSLTWLEIESGRLPAKWSGFWTLIGWSSGGRWHDGYCWSGWGRHRDFVVVHRRGTRFGRPVGEACREIS